MLQSADAGQIQSWLEQINTFSATPGEGTTRMPFSAEDLGARRYVKGEMEKLGLVVTEDAAGNIFGTLPGSQPELAPVWTGSHLDTVIHGGMFDGICGVVGGLEAVRLIRAAGIVLRRSLSVVVYTNEEGTQFGSGCLGSRALAGLVSLADTKEFLSLDGVSLYDTLSGLGYDLNKWDELPKKTGDVFASVELHIEQSGRLEQNQKAIGIVRAICATLYWEITVHGKQSHAGGTSMDERQDAYMAACEMALALEKINKASKSAYTTATVGRVAVYPNASNVIPGKVVFTVDVRDAEYDTKQQLVAEFRGEIDRIAERRGVVVELNELENDRPVSCDKAIMDIIEDSARRLDIPYLHTFSGAFHDSMFVAAFAPAAMIFVPSKNGISHSPAEWTDFAQIADGVNVLASTLVSLCNQV